MMNPLITDRQLYAMSIFSWCKAHPWATEENFREFLAHVERQVQGSTAEVTFKTSPEVAETAWQIGPEGLEAMIRKARIR
jgi:hypothetical protein